MNNMPEEGRNVFVFQLPKLSESEKHRNLSEILTPEAFPIFSTSSCWKQPTNVVVFENSSDCSPNTSQRKSLQSQNSGKKQCKARNLFIIARGELSKLLKHRGARSRGEISKAISEVSWMCVSAFEI